MVTTERVFDMFKENPDDPMDYFRDISTFGGCTAGPAAAIENMKIIEEEDLLGNTLAMGDRLMGNLEALKEKHACVGDVRGKGLFAGAELVADRSSAAARWATYDLKRALSSGQGRAGPIACCWKRTS
jgi:taurine-pyruvate aminotransferase